MLSDFSLPPRQPGHALPREWYLSPQVFARDMERFFHRRWIFAAPLAALRECGDYAALEVGDTPLFVLRGEDGALRAFHNVCRHRGSRLLSAPFGNIGGRKIICPYHQWSYACDGALARASHCPQQPDAATHSLLPVRCETLAGGVYVCLQPDEAAEREIALAKRHIGEHLAAYNCEQHRIAHHSTHIVAANWKLAVENNRECGHCRGAHPELMACVFDFGMGDDGRGSGAYAAAEKAMLEACAPAGITAPTLDFPEDSFFRIARLPYRRGFQSETTDGAPACAKPLGVVPPAAGQLRLVALPNCWSHYLSDYCVMTRLLPVAPMETRLDVFWAVHEDAIAGQDYQLERLTEVWEQTTIQDARLIQENQAGVKSPAYRPGPYSPITESLVEHFADWYSRRAGAAAPSVQAAG